MTLTKECKYCGELFIPKRDWQKFCSKDHQQAYWKKIYDERYDLSKRVEKVEEELGIKGKHFSEESKRKITETYKK